MSKEDMTCCCYGRKLSMLPSQYHVPACAYTNVVGTNSIASDEPGTPKHEVTTKQNTPVSSAIGNAW